MEANNMAAMREAFKKLDEELQFCERNVVLGLGFSFEGLLEHCRIVRQIINAALTEPPRNCDVGTAEEQTTRYRKFCSDHKYLSSDFSYRCKGFGKGRCPFSGAHTKSQCEFAWAQMPYEEGGAA